MNCIKYTENQLPEQLKEKIYIDEDNCILKIKCRDSKITVSNYHSINLQLLKRGDEWFAIVRKKDICCSYINLNTGEIFNSSITFSKFLQSPDGNYILIDSYERCYTSTLLIDIRDLSDINIVYNETFDRIPEYKFNANSDLVIKYYYEFYEYEDIVEFDETDLIKRRMVENKLYKGINDIGDKEMWKEGVKIHVCEPKLTLRPDPSKITPYIDEKLKPIPSYHDQEYYDLHVMKYDETMMSEWCRSHNRTLTEIQNSDKAREYYEKYESKYGTTLNVNEMVEISIENNDEFEKFLKCRNDKSFNIYH